MSLTEVESLCVVYYLVLYFDVSTVQRNQTRTPKKKKIQKNLS